MSEEILDAEIIEEGEARVVNEEVIEAIDHGMSKLYICGPMSGHDDWNHPMFHKVTQEFRNVNFQVCNPAEFFDGDTSRDRKDYMREAFKYLLEADTIVLLPGWEESKGARLEAAIATELELIIVEYVEDENNEPIVGSLTPVEVDEEGNVVEQNLGSFIKVDTAPTE